MTSRSSGPDVLDLALSQEAYRELVERKLLGLARAFLDDVEVNAQLFAERTRGGTPPDSSHATEPTLDALIAKLAPSGLKLFRLGFVDSYVAVPGETEGAPETQSFLRSLLVPAAREVARLSFAGRPAEATTRELWAKKRELLIRGELDTAAAIEIAEDDEALEYADEFRPNIFQGACLVDLDRADEFTAADDNERLEACERAERARAQLVTLLSECKVPRQEWTAEVITLGERIDAMIEEGFLARENASGDLTRDVFEGVRAAFASVGEKSISVCYGYTGKIMELALLVDARGGSRFDRVRKALSRSKGLGT
jgi:hypothetical protein